jgi:hypothetical protein
VNHKDQELIMHWLLGGYMFLYIHRPFEIWPILGDLQVERVYMLLTILFWLFHPGKRWVGNRMFGAFVAFLAVVVLCWVASPYLETGSELVENLVKILIFCMLVATTVHDEQDLRRMVLLFLGCMTLYMLHSLWEYQNGRHVVRMGVARMVGVGISGGDPNSFSATLLYSLPLTFPFWLEAAGDRRKRNLLLLYTGLAVFCILETGSRGGLIGLVCLGLLCLVRSQQRVRFAMVLLLAVPLTLGLMRADLQTRFQTILDPSVGPANAQESAAGRTVGLLNGIKLWTQSPVTGYGPEAFAKATGSGFQAHNLYGQMLGELGSLGVVAFCGVLWAFAANGREIRRLYRQYVAPEGSFSYHLGTAILVTVLLLLVMGMGGHNLYRYTWFWYGTFQALAVWCLRAQVQAGEEGFA